jgi:hypothetical protein
MKLKNEDPSMRKSFENFISSMCMEINRSKADFNILESALQKYFLQIFIIYLIPFAVFQVFKIVSATYLVNQTTTKNR